MCGWWLGVPAALLLLGRMFVFCIEYVVMLLIILAIQQTETHKALRYYVLV
jgi:hypothetical protein